MRICCFLRPAGPGLEEVAAVGVVIDPNNPAVAWGACSIKRLLLLNGVADIDKNDELLEELKPKAGGFGPPLVGAPWTEEFEKKFAPGLLFIMGLELK